MPFSLVLFDIDHFKRLNDAFGHQAGDHVLREIARCVSIRLSRRGDRVFRIGGEEFAVLASASDERQIVCLMEKIRKTPISVLHQASRLLRILEKQQKCSYSVLNLQV